jgi:hypothetical protein
VPPERHGGYGALFAAPYGHQPQPQEHRMKFAIATSLLVVTTALCYASHTRAATVGVRFTEGVAHGFPVLRSVEGEQLAAGEFTQIARDDLVESRFVFRFHDGSLYEETVVFSQRSVFQLEHYRIVQRGRSFPETLEASIDRSSGRYDVRYRADEDALEERLSGRFTLPEDVYSGMLGTLMKNVAPGESPIVHILVFTPQPRVIKVQIASAGEDTMTLGGRPVPTFRYLIKPQLGMLASLLVVDLAPIQCWIIAGDAPAFVKFQGPLYFMGPVWRIELN